MNLIEHIDFNCIPSEDVLDERYANSPFRVLRSLPVKQKGKYYEEITENILMNIGHVVEKPLSTDYDRIVDGKRIEIKGSTLNKGTDVFSFLQIRPNQEYDEVYFSMFYPDQVYICSLTKSQVVSLCEQGIFKPQHGGKKGDSGTFCYYGNKETLERIGALIIE